jgi:hypothetical protein
MGTYTQEERDKMPASAFCGANRTFPILDAEDVQKAVPRLNTTDHAVDPIKACIIGKAKAHGWAYPDAWKDEAEHSIGAACPSGLPGAAFDAGGTVRRDGEHVIRRGLIFRAGDYPDKQFSAEPEDLWAACQGFTAVPVDLEHTPTVLQDKLGTLDKIELSANGQELYGEVRLPAWLDAVLDATERKVSCTWDRVTKRLVGLALVRTPRVTDAVLMAAFAGQRHSAKDAADMQQIHDLARGQGAACDPNDPTKGNDPMTDPQTTPEQTLMSKFFGWLTAGAPAAPTAPATFAAPPATLTTSPAPSAPAAQPDPEKEALRQQIAQLRAQQIADRAAAFAGEQLAANKALPAQRDALIAAYTAAAADDAEHGQAHFATGRGSRVDALAAIFAAAPTHSLTTEQVPVDPAAMRQLPTPGQLAGAKSARFSEGQVDPREVMRLLGTDPVGKTILRDMALTAATAGGKAGK